MSKYDADKNMTIPKQEVEVEPTKSTVVAPPAEEPVKTSVIKPEAPKNEPIKGSAITGIDLSKGNQPKPAVDNVVHTDDADRVRQELVSYLDSVRKAKTPKTKASAQMGLYLIIKRIVGSEDQSGFRRQWVALLNFIRENNNDINELTVFQGMYEWTLGETELRAYRYIMTLVFASLEVKTRRQGLDKIDVQLLFSSINTMSPKGEQNILSFYER